MPIVTIILTRHEDIGLCNSIALFEIINNLKPEIIFEELPNENLDDFYLAETKENLETRAISKYTKLNDIPHFGVDLKIDNYEKVIQEYESVFRKIENSTTEYGFSLRNAIDEHKANSLHFGFNYLNSSLCLNICQRIEKAITDGVNHFEDQKFKTIQQNWNLINRKRELQILHNIEKYYQSTGFQNAILTIGAQHGPSLRQIVENHRQNNIIWRFYNPLAST
jgi:hypothetical protein